VACSPEFPWPGQNARLVEGDRVAVLGSAEPFTYKVVDLWAAVTNQLQAGHAAVLAGGGLAAAPVAAPDTLFFPAAAWDAGAQLLSVDPAVQQKGRVALLRSLERAPPLLGSRCWAFPICDGVDVTRLQWRLLLAMLPPGAASLGQPSSRTGRGDAREAAPKPAPPAPGRFVLLDSRPPNASLMADYKKAARTTAAALVAAVAASCAGGGGPSFSAACVADWTFEVPGGTPKHSGTHDSGLAVCLFMRKAASASPALTDMKGVRVAGTGKEVTERRRTFWDELLRQAGTVGATVRAPDPSR
jgi:hypothetical protein